MHEEGPSAKLPKPGPSSSSHPRVPVGGPSHSPATQATSLPVVNISAEAQGTGHQSSTPEQPLGEGSALEGNRGPGTESRAAEGHPVHDQGRSSTCGATLQEQALERLQALSWHRVDVCFAGEPRLSGHPSSPCLRHSPRDRCASMVCAKSVRKKPGCALMHQAWQLHLFVHQDPCTCCLRRAWRAQATPLCQARPTTRSRRGAGSIQRGARRLWRMCPHTWPTSYAQKPCRAEQPSGCRDFFAPVRVSSQVAHRCV